MVTVYKPTTIDEFGSVVREAEKVRICGHRAGDLWSVRATGPFGKITVVDDPTETVIDTTEYSGISAWHSEDQVLVVKAGTDLRLLQQELMTKGQCLPMVDWYDGYSPKNVDGTVGGCLSLNLPESLEYACGPPRDWVLGMTVVLADGQVVKSGSKAVKNVAGYDAQKLFIGARGTLGVIVEVIFKTHPLASLPTPMTRKRYIESNQAEHFWVQRVCPSDFDSLENAAERHGYFSDRDSSVIFALVHPDQGLPRFPGDWVLRSGCGEKNLQITDPVMIKYMKRAKEIFDPTNKLNPGEMGIF